MLINVFRVFRALPWVTDELARLEGLAITIIRVECSVRGARTHN
jgi:hypothetical protein